MSASASGDVCAAWCWDFQTWCVTGGCWSKLPVEDYSKDKKISQLEIWSRKNVETNRIGYLQGPVRHFKTEKLDIWEVLEKRIQWKKAAKPVFFEGRFFTETRAIPMLSVSPRFCTRWWGAMQPWFPCCRGRFFDPQELNPKPDLYKTMSGIQRFGSLNPWEFLFFSLRDVRLCRKWAKAPFSGYSLQLYV